MPESVLLTGVLLCRFASVTHLVNSDRDVKAWICFLPHLWVSPVIVLISAVNHGIKSRVDFPTLKNILCLLVRFVANAVGVRSGGGYEEIQRLHTRVTGAFRHNIKQLSVRLGVKFIKNYTVNIETVL